MVAPGPQEPTALERPQASSLPPRENAQVQGTQTQRAQAEQLQTLIKQEIERLKEAGQRRRLWPGASEDRTADLSHLATALKDASATRLATLEGIAPHLTDPISAPQSHEAHSMKIEIHSKNRTA